MVQESEPAPSATDGALLEKLELLSRREQEVALLVRKQLTNKEIAQELVL
ncbi:hypothetical protein HGQ17_09600 [Nesterenkonia sp. MY13]|uniref:HTH luxR-type domain-containing protein n=1 Tax=Nesterenkonia sedimenti TaxID=1463632 RepID=A0A7X8YE86_9MICC|nr:hypothetical protein [Nesterenkonia sedimenti]NLS10240.1 hypothetical protein [Nesterenkonia sedimenti]